MSVEIVLYPPSATRQQLCQHLLACGFAKCEHLWEWREGSLHFGWFDDNDFRSFDGVEATVFPLSEEERQEHGCGGWGLHTRTRASASSFDKEHQNNVIRSARKAFGGHFENDWHGRNRYTPVEPDDRCPAGRGIFLSYEFVKEKIGAVRYALPQPTKGMQALQDQGSHLAALARYDPVRVLYNALVPFAVAALEHFFGQAFRILLHYDEQAQKHLREQAKKVEIQDVIAISEGRKTIEQVVADWYSFQNLASIHNAFKEWLGIDFWGLLRQRKKVGKHLPFLEQHLSHVIEFRHGVVHRLELDYDLDYDQIVEILDVAVVVIETFIDHLEQERGLKIRDE